MDKTLRNLTRKSLIDPSPEAKAALLKEQIRAEIKVPLQEIPVIHTHEFHKRTWPDAVILDITKLKAYLGDPIAREIAGYADACLLCNKPIGFIHLPEHCTDIETWAAEIPGLAAPLPSIVVSGVACHCGEPSSAIPNPDCSDCNRTGTRYIEIPAAQYLSVKMVSAVGRACIEASQTREAKISFPDPYQSRVIEILDAAEAWLRCPCPERAERLHRGCGIRANRQMRWVPCHCLLEFRDDHLEIFLASAAEIIGTEKVRTAAGLGVLSG